MSCTGTSCDEDCECVRKETKASWLRGRVGHYIMFYIWLLLIPGCLGFCCFLSQRSDRQARENRERVRAEKRANKTRQPSPFPPKAPSQPSATPGGWAGGGAQGQVAGVVPGQVLQGTYVQQAPALAHPPGQVLGGTRRPAATFSVAVPQGASPGETLQVTAPNGVAIQVQIPAGCGSGSTIQVAIPMQPAVVQNGRPGYYTTNPLYPGQIQMGAITDYSRRV